MDRPRTARDPSERRIILAGLMLGGIVLIFFAASRIGPASPSIDRAVVSLDTVRRGEMIRQVRGPGKLVPEYVRWVTASHDGRVDRILYLPGAVVQADSVLLELSNPELELQLLQARFGYLAAEAEQANLAAQLDSQVLAQRSAVAVVASEAKQALLRLEVDRQLSEKGLIAALELNLSEVKVEELQNRQALEQQRLSGLTKLADAQLRANLASVEQAHALYQLRKEQVGGLVVKAGVSGVVQEIPLQVGQRVTPGSNLALVVDPSRLKARLRIPETQTSDVHIGQPARVDTRNGIIGGKVERIDPSVREATVTVDILLEDELPAGARPDMNVDGIIEIERLTDVLHVNRPAFGREEGAGSIFRIDSQETAAIRTSVRFGRTSVTEIEIVNGLSEGDLVIVSDTSKWDGVDQIRLN
jgi:HlyD family secretion protein